MAPAVPPIGDLMMPSLAAVAEAGGEASNDEIRAAVGRLLGLSSDTMQMQHGPKGTRTELEYRLAWARTRLSKAGLVEAVGPRRWRLTPSGWTKVEGAPTASSKEPQ
jgi:restriction system protein